MSSTDDPGDRRLLAIDAPIIILTHFINPHRFWFKYESSVMNGNEALDQLELDLQQHLLVMNQRRLYRAGYEPERGEHVAFKHLVWSKWVRARVDHIIEILGEGKKYLVWTTDHG